MNVFQQNPLPFHQGQTMVPVKPSRPYFMEQSPGGEPWGAHPGIWDVVYRDFERPF